MELLNTSCSLGKNWNFPGREGGFLCLQLACHLNWFKFLILLTIFLNFYFYFILITLIPTSKFNSSIMPETRGSTRERRGEFSLTASMQNWSHNLPEDHGKAISLFCGRIGAPAVKISAPAGYYGTPMGKYML